MFFQDLLEHFNLPHSAELVWIFTKMLFLVIVKVDIPPQFAYEQERDKKDICTILKYPTIANLED